MSASGSRLNFWLVTLGMVLVAVVTAALGVWQLDRAAMKESLLQQREQRERLPALGWDALLRASDQGQLAALHDRTVRLRGRWLDKATVYLDNRPMNGRSGFFVVTPLLPEGGGAALLVQRGWVPRHFSDRTVLPKVQTPMGEVEVTGRLAPPPSRLYEFAGDEHGPIRQNIDLDAFAAEWSWRLVSASVLEAPVADNAGDGLLRDWPHVGSDVYKHYGYAVQWFGLCTLSVLLYVWFQIIAPRRRRA